VPLTPKALKRKIIVDAALHIFSRITASRVKRENIATDIPLKNGRGINDTHTPSINAHTRKNLHMAVNLRNMPNVLVEA
jgi:hypothetical protein